MWLLFAIGSAVFAGLTAILAKIGVRNADSDAVTALRTVVVLIFAWIMVFVTGTQTTIPSIGVRSLIFLILSGLATGASWICYFKALSLGDVNKVAPVDKSSVILTMILAMIFFGEFSWFSLAAIPLIAIGTYLMIEFKPNTSGEKRKSPSWLIWALLSAVFAALTSLLGKVGVEGVDSNVGTAIRTCVVLVMAWLIVIIRKKLPAIPKIDGKSYLFIILSGIATGASWLCYWRAIKDGLLTVVIPIDKLSILFVVAFSCIFLKEKLSPKSAIGLVLITVGTLVTILPTILGL